MNHTERLLYGFEPNTKERLEDLQREHDFETFKVEPPMSKPYDPNFIEDYQEQPERQYYDEQLKPEAPPEAKNEPTSPS